MGQTLKKMKIRSRKFEFAFIADYQIHPSNSGQRVDLHLDLGSDRKISDPLSCAYQHLLI